VECWEGVITGFSSFLPKLPMPRFVLLEHTWNGVHWDFMLEAGEVLRTWAIDAPVVAGKDLPARALGDHRKRYLEYEGEISGQRGQVRRVDAGTFGVLLWSADHIRVQVAGTQLAGVVDLRLRKVESGAGSPWLFRLGKLD
jgi:DNA polymerase Ligase (LigD)